jgi:hypothetical protein
LARAAALGYRSIIVVNPRSFQWLAMDLVLSAAVYVALALLFR